MGALIAPEYIPVYKERLQLFRELPLNIENAFELLDALSMRETFRSALQEAARPAAALGLNIDDPVAVFRRYSSLTRMALGMLALEANRPQHKRTFGGKLVVITTP